MGRNQLLPVKCFAVLFWRNQYFQLFKNRKNALKPEMHEARFALSPAFVSTLLCLKTWVSSRRRNTGLRAMTG